MTSKKLGALLQSAPPATARPAPEAEPAARPASSETVVRRIAPAAVVRDEPEVPLQVLVPARIREELGVMMARERGASLRSLILRAVRSLGIEVTDEEIRGKRGRKRS